MSDQQRDRVDVTFMYAVHDGFQRDLDRLAAMADAGDAAGPAVQAERLADGLGVHCEQEEEQALPLVQDLFTKAEWDAFGNEQRRRLGVSGAASFFPWLLDGAEEDTRRTVLGVVPPPVRLLYRAVWRPRYLRVPRWQSPARAH